MPRGGGAPTSRFVSASISGAEPRPWLNGTRMMSENKIVLQVFAWEFPVASDSHTEFKCIRFVIVPVSMRGQRGLEAIPACMGFEVSGTQWGCHHCSRSERKTSLKTVTFCVLKAWKTPSKLMRAPYREDPAWDFKPRSFTARLRCQPLSYATIRITKTISLPLKTILWVTWRACMSVGNRCCTRCQLRGEY